MCVPSPAGPSPAGPSPAADWIPLHPWKGPQENWQMAVAVKTCLPLLVSFGGPRFPLLRRWDSRGRQSRVLNINPDPGPVVCLESPRKGRWRNCQLGELMGVSLVIWYTFGGRAGERSPNWKISERGRERKPFLTLTLVFNDLIIFAWVRHFTENFSFGEVQKQNETNMGLYISVQGCFLWGSHDILKWTF